MEVEGRSAVTLEACLEDQGGRSALAPPVQGLYGRRPVRVFLGFWLMGPSGCSGA